MKSYLFLLLAGFCMVQLSCAQSKPMATLGDSSNLRIETDAFKYVQFVTGRYNSFEVDVYGNMFVVTASNQLKKISPAGDSISVFNDVKRYGNPSLIDVSNPLKILLYYKNFATAVFLDRLLTLRGSLNFRTSNIFAAKAVATSYDNQIWLFDEQDFTLKKIDELGKLLLSSNDLRNQLGVTPFASTIIDRENVVYVYDINQGFFLFDYYGAYKKTISVTGWEDVNVSGDVLYGFKEGKLCVYNSATLIEKKFELPKAFLKNKMLKAINGKLYLLAEDGIYVFEIK